MAPALANYVTLFNGMPESERWYFLSEEADMLHEVGRRSDAEAKLEQSLQSGEHVWNLWKKARFQAARGHYEDAFVTVGKMKVLADSGVEQELQWYTNLEPEITEGLQTWKANQNRLLELNRDIWTPFSEAYAAGEADKYIALHSKDFVRASKSGDNTTDLDGYAKQCFAQF